MSHMVNYPLLETKGGHLFFDGKDLVEIAKNYGTPVYVFSERRLKENVREILDAFRHYHPNTTLHYASKCEATIANLQIIREAGSDIEVNSGGELYKALYAGFTPEQIIFNGVAKTVSELEYAINQGIKSINVDSLFEMKRIIETAKRLDKKANVTVRFVPEVSTGVVKGNETGTHETKFGVTQDKLVETIELCLSNKEYINLHGIHFHIGTQTYHLESFVEAFQVMLREAIYIYEATGYKAKTLNIGGGLPVPHFIDIEARQYMPYNIYHMFRGVLSTKDIAEKITAELRPESIAKLAGDKYSDFFEGCELIIEAGRKVVADAAVLLSTVENEKRRDSIDEDWIMIDAGFNTLLEAKTYNWYYHMICANKSEEAHTRDIKVAGPCCDSGDVFFDIDYHKNLPEYRSLPASATPGDIIAMLNVGAYGTPNMSNYNGRPKAGVLLIQENGTISVSRPGETYEDLVKMEPKVDELRGNK